MDVEIFIIMITVGYIHAGIVGLNKDRYSSRKNV